MKTLTPLDIKNSLLDSIAHLLEDKATFFNSPETAFSRTQKISLQDAMILPMISTSESTSVEMLDYFPLSKMPSQAALSYRRSQIKVEAFENLFKNFTSLLPKHKTFHGMQLIACDGTRLNTPYNPNDSASFVNCVEGRKGFNQYHLNCCYDILNDLYIDATIQNYFSMHETAAFCEMMDRYPSHTKALFVADRGYDSYNAIAHAINNNHHFVIRLKASKAMSIFDDIKEIKEEDSFDIEDDIFIGRVRNKTSKTLRNYHFIRYNHCYDYIPVGSKTIDHFRVRLVKLKLSENNFEYLLTNLSQSKFSEDQLKEIYRLRWGIETSYRYLKYTSGLNHIHSLKPEFIFQEIYAKLTAYNFCSAVMKCISIKETIARKHNHKIEKTYFIKVCLRFLQNKIANIEELVKKRKVPVRAGRKFERNIRRQHADTLQYR